MDNNRNVDYSKIVVGLDIGTTKVACFIGQRDENNPGKIKILGYYKDKSEGVARGEVKNILEASKTIRNVVAEAARMANCPVREVYVGIAGQHVKSMPCRGDITIPKDHDLITQGDVDNLIEDQRTILFNRPEVEIIHIVPQRYYVDDEELQSNINPVGVPGRKLGANFHIVTGNTAAIKNIKRSVEMADLKIKGVCLEPIASAEAILTAADRQTGTAIIDIGGGTTDVAIFTKNVIRYTTVIPLAGESITSDIENGCNILPTQAEILKTTHGTCLPDEIQKDAILSIKHTSPGHAPVEISLKNLASIIKARTENIIDLIWLSLNESRVSDKLGGGIVLTGGGSKLQGIAQYMSYKTGLETRIGYPTEYLVSDGKIKEFSDPIFSTCIGLVLRGFKEVEEFERKQPARSAIEDILDNQEPVGENGGQEKETAQKNQTADLDKNTDSDQHLTMFGKISSWLKNALIDNEDM